MKHTVTYNHQSQFIELIKSATERVKLSALAEYTIGLTYAPKDISESGEPVLRSGNIQNGEIDISDLVRVSSTIKERLQLAIGDILMCSRNGSAALVGKSAIIKTLPEPMTFGAFMTVIRSSQPEYLNTFFQSSDFRKQISSGKSSTMNQITQKMLDNITVPIVSEVEIMAFAAFVRQADKSKYYVQNKQNYICHILTNQIQLRRCS